MNKPKSSKKTILIIIAIILVALLAYFYYEGNKPVSNSNLTSASANIDAEAVGTRVLSMLNQIKSLKIDTAVFKDSSYQTLRDYSVAIPQEDVGRPNPFAPLPGMESTTATNSRARVSR